jgi:hypothetical protein
MYETVEETVSKTVYKDPQPGMPEPPTGKRFTYVIVGICIFLALLIIFS